MCFLQCALLSRLKILFSHYLETKILDLAMPFWNKPATKLAASRGTLFEISTEAECSESFFRLKAWKRPPSSMPQETYIRCICKASGIGLRIRGESVFRRVCGFHTVECRSHLPECDNRAAMFVVMKFVQNDCHCIGPIQPSQRFKLASAFPSVN